jgi:hypothetical protein
VSNATPTALTPITLQALNLDTNSPFTVTWTWPDASTTDVTPIRFDATGSIVLATPLYIDPATGQTANASVQVAIAQGTQASPPVAIAIQDIPSVLSYGVAPGDISRAFLNYLTISLSRSVNYLKALQAFPANKVDSSGARAAITRQMLDTIEMRNNVDMIVAGTQKSLAVGMTTDGQPVQFNATSVDMIDRLLAMHLTACGYFAAAGAGALRTRRAIRRGTEQLRRPMAYADAIKTLSSLSGVTGMIGGEIGTFHPINGENKIGDNVASLFSGLASIGGLVAEAAGAPALVTLAAVVGAVAGAYIVGHDIQNVLQSEQGLTAQTLAKITFDAVGTVASAFGVKAIGNTGWVADVVKDMANFGGDGISGVLMQGSGFISNLGATTLGVIDLAQSAQAEHASASPPQGLGSVDGQVSVQNSAGPILSGLPGVVLNDPTSGTQLECMADTAGDYDMVAPVGVSGLDYPNMQVFTYDPVSNVGTGAPVPVDLSGLVDGGTIQAPLAEGECNDDDAGDPDSDDPDCD